MKRAHSFIAFACVATICVWVACGGFDSADAQMVNGWNLGASASSSSGSSSGSSSSGGLVYLNVPPFMPTPAGVSAKYSAVPQGDSLVGGWSSDAGNSAQFQSWPEQMAFMLGSGVALPVNYGIGGTTCAQMIAGATTAASYIVPGTIGVAPFQCGTNDIAFIDAGSGYGITEITNAWQAAAQKEHDAGFAKTYVYTIPANVYFDPTTSQYTGTPYYQLLDAGANYPSPAWDYYLNLSNTYALGTISDGGPPSGGVCALPPVASESWGSNCYRIDDIIHMTPNADMIAGWVNALAFAQVTGGDSGTPAPIAPAQIPLDPSHPSTPSVLYYGEDKDLTLDGDDLTASSTGPDGVFFSSTMTPGYVYKYTGLSIFWGTGSVLPGIDSGAPGYSAPGVLNLSVAGDTCATLAGSTHGTSVDAYYSSPHRKDLLFSCGTHDGIVGTTAASACASALSYASSRYATGWKVYIAGIPDNPNFATTGAVGYAATFNACVSAGAVANHATFINFGAGSSDPYTGAYVGSSWRPYFFADGDGGLLSWPNGAVHYAYEAVISIAAAGGY